MNIKHDDMTGFAERVRLNQQGLRAALKAQYDFIVCGSIMPRITTRNTTAPCVIIGELAADFVRASYGL
jgi:hypothetical protein